MNIRIYEETYFNIFFQKRFCELNRPFQLPLNIKSAFRRKLLSFFRDYAYSVILCVDAISNISLKTPMFLV